jgi:hypothetical protein
VGARPGGAAIVMTGEVFAKARTRQEERAFVGMLDESRSGFGEDWRVQITCGDIRPAPQVLRFVFLPTLLSSSIPC